MLFRALHLLNSHLDAHFQSTPPHIIIHKTLLTLLIIYALRKLSETIQKNGLKRSFINLIFKILRLLPISNKQLEKEITKTLSKLEQMVISPLTIIDEFKYPELPQKGLSQHKILSKLMEWSTHETQLWEKGQVSGAVYLGDKQFNSFTCKAYELFALSNPLHPDVFPFIRKMESEVISMSLRIFNGNSSCVGCMTSGGTESILLAMKAYRDRAVKEYGFSINDTLEILCSKTAHAAFEKAAKMFRMKLTELEPDPITFRLRPKDVEKALTKKTIVVICSAPNFPNGTLDPIEEIAQIVLERGRIGLHVDCCLGSFLLPFIESPYTKFDFRVEGVTSISADTHKYGYAPKGTSILMYSSAELRQYQYSISVNWSGGIYATPSIAGSRPGGLIAATYAAMLAMGEEGYRQKAQDIMLAARKIKQGIEQIEGLKIVGMPEMSVISFRVDENSKFAKSLNIYKINECMATHYHWNLNTLQNPSSIHICCTYLHIHLYEKFLEDLNNSVKFVLESPNEFKSGSAAIYGMTGTVDSTFVEDLARGFIDCLFKTK